MLVLLRTLWKRYCFIVSQHPLLLLSQSYIIMTSYPFYATYFFSLNTYRKEFIVTVLKFHDDKGSCMLEKKNLAVNDKLTSGSFSLEQLYLLIIGKFLELFFSNFFIFVSFFLPF